VIPGRSRANAMLLLTITPSWHQRDHVKGTPMGTNADSSLSHTLAEASFVPGGRFYRAQQALGLIHPNHWNLGRRIAVLIVNHLATSACANRPFKFPRLEFPAAGLSRCIAPSFTKNGFCIVPVMKPNFSRRPRTAPSRILVRVTRRSNGSALSQQTNKIRFPSRSR
jgi:hypothetical protein